jgi:membrane associated rhomboid family serine protease
MTKQKAALVSVNRDWRDAAVDGLRPGLVGGVLMLAYLLAMGLLAGGQPLEILAYFLPDETLPPVAGIGLHLATSAVYGAVLGLITAAIGRRRPEWLPPWLVGLLFGLLLWLAASLIIVPGKVSGMEAVPSGRLLVSHLVYGLAAGRLLAPNRP